MPHKDRAAAVVSVDDGSFGADDRDRVALGAVSHRDDCALVSTGCELNRVAGHGHLHRLTDGHRAGAVGRHAVNGRGSLMKDSRR